MPRPPATPAPGLSPGIVIAGKYELLARIGAGGMGVVHSARRRDLDDIVAIKSVLPERLGPRNRARFMREARALARIRHPNVVQVFDLGELADGCPYMVMEFVEGPTLARVLQRSRPSVAYSVALFSDVCRAVEAGHRRGVVHRDLKPGNVMLARSDDGGETVKVLDFGLASLLDEQGDRSRPGGLVGTVAYMAPEGVRSGTASPASDLFSLGVLLYELVTGRVPFRGSNAIATVMAICEDDYVSPRELVPGLPDAVVAAIDAALQKRPGDRPGSALELGAMARGEPWRAGEARRSMGGGLRVDGEGSETWRSDESEDEGSGSSVSSSDSRRSGELYGKGLGGRDGPELGGPDTLVGDELTLGGDSASMDLRSLGPRDADATRDSSPGQAGRAGQLSGAVTMIATAAGATAKPSPSRSGDSSADGSGRGEGGRSPEGVRASLSSLPLVGRSLELEALAELFAAAPRRDATPIAVVLGDPGMGRSRLLERFGEYARERGGAVFEGRFWSYDGDRAPAEETFTRMLGDARVASTAPREREAGNDRRSGHGVLAQRFADAARGRTLVLILDDLHRAPRRDLEFLTFLVRGQRLPVPVVVVASARRAAARTDARTELSRWLLQLSGLEARTSVLLSALGEDELRACLHQTFGRVRVRPRDLRRLRRACAGVPRTFAELLRHLLGRGAIHRLDDGSWVCEPLPRRVLPEGLRATVEAELASVDPELRKLLDAAAVIGETLRFEALERVLGKSMDEDTLDELVDQAVAEGWLEELGDKSEGGADELRFRDGLVREVLYDGLGTRRRRRLHRGVVQALLEIERPGRVAKILAGHYRALAAWPETLRWGLRAARRAVERHDHDAAEHALEHAEHALKALEQEEGERALALVRARVDVDALAGTLDARVGRFAEGVSRLRGVSGLLDRHGDALDSVRTDGASGLGSGARSVPELRFEVALALARCHLGKGELATSAEAGRQALALAEALVAGGELDQGRAREAEWEARVALGHTLARFGDWPEASAVLTPVVEVEPLPHLRVLHVLALRELGWVEARSGRGARADALARQAEAEARASGEPLAEYCAHSLMAVVLSARGDNAEAITRYRAALRGARALSLRRREMIELANLSMSLVLLAGREREASEDGSSSQSEGGPDSRILDEALEGMLGVIGICEELGDVASAGDARVGLGRVLRARGNVDEAIASFRRGFATCEEVGRREYAALALFEIGRCELERGAWAAAREVLELAHERLAGAGSLHAWEIELGLARAARGLGDEERALIHAAAADERLRESHSEGEGLARGLAAIAAFSASSGASD